MATGATVKINQKWRVRKAFRVNRNGEKFEVPVGSILEVKTMPQDSGEIWVNYQGQRFRISHENITAKAEPC